MRPGCPKGNSVSIRLLPFLLVRRRGMVTNAASSFGVVEGLALSEH